MWWWSWRGLDQGHRSYGASQEQAGVSAPEGSGGRCDATRAGASPQTVLSGNAPAQTASGSFSWRVIYDSTNPAQDDIAASCHEVSSLTVNNNAP